LENGDVAPGMGHGSEISTMPRGARNLTSSRYGPSNAVSAFLQNLGVRWLMPGELGEIVPPADSIALPKIDETVRPDFDIRQFSFHGPREWTQWGMRLGVRYPYGMHTAHGMSRLGRQKIFDAHPEWFAMYGGKRQFDPNETNNHFCYSNDGLFHETVRCVRAQFDVYDFEGVSVMPPDAYISICQCPLCSGKDDPERGPRGSLSNHVWGFVNRVAKEVAKTHRHVKSLVRCPRNFFPRGEVGAMRCRTKAMRYSPSGAIHCRTNGLSTGRPAEKAKSEGRQELVDLDEGQFPGLVGRGGLALPLGVRLIDPAVFRRRGSGRRRVPQPAVAQNLLDNSPLRWFKKRDHLHLALALRAAERVDFVDALDQHGPRLARAASPRSL